MWFWLWLFAASARESANNAAKRIENVLKPCARCGRMGRHSDDKYFYAVCEECLIETHNTTYIYNLPRNKSERQRQFRNAVGLLAGVGLLVGIVYYVASSANDKYNSYRESHMWLYDANYDTKHITETRSQAVSKLALRVVVINKNILAIKSGILAPYCDGREHDRDLTHSLARLRSKADGATLLSKLISEATSPEAVYNLCRADFLDPCIPMSTYRDVVLRNEWVSLSSVGLVSGGSFQEIMKPHK